MLTPAETAALRARCDRALSGHGTQRPADLLATIPPETAPDGYGDGGVVEELEREVAGLLGKPAAVFVPSGIMAQQATLRAVADRSGRRTVAYHPTSHLQLHELGAAERLHGLLARPVGGPDRLLSLDDLRGVAEPLAALLLELPQREIGGQQPAWADLVELAGWARSRGAWAHLDGARIWESAAGYGVAPAEVAAVFDSVYASFYKGIGALPGCCVAGAEDLVAEVREWRKRMGGTLCALWPNAASALTCLRRRLPLFPEYLQHARAVAGTLREVPGVTVVPDPPQVPMMHLLLRVPAATFAANAVRLAESEGVWTWPRAMPTLDPAVQRVELGVGDATLAWSPEQVRDLVGRLLEPAAAGGD